MKIHIFLKKSTFILLIISKKLELKKSSEVKFYSIFSSLTIYLNSGHSLSLTQAWNQVAEKVNFYPSFKLSSCNLGPNVSILKVKLVADVCFAYNQ
jgi:hypothetical protein